MKKFTLTFLTILPLLTFSQTNLTPNPTFNTNANWSDQNPGTGQGFDATDTRTVDGSGLWIVVSNGTFNSRVQSDNIAIPAGDYLFTYWVRGNAGVKTKPFVRDNDLASTGTPSTPYTIQNSNTWEKVEWVYTSAGTTSASLRIGVNDNTSGVTIELDDVSFYKLTTENSFVSNPDFEDGIDPLTDWSLGGPDVSLSSTTGNGGGNAAQINFTQDITSQSNNLLTNIVYDFGKTVNPSELVASFDAMSNNTGIQIQITARTFDASDNTVETLNTGAVTVAVANVWETFNFNPPFTMPFNKILFRIRVKGAALIGDKVAIDNVAASFSYLTLGTKDVASKAIGAMTLYPNPAKDILNVKSVNKVSSISIYDISGKQVLATDRIFNNQLDVSSLRNGIYLVRLEDIDHNFDVKKLVISK